MTPSFDGWDGAKVSDRKAAPSSTKTSSLSLILFVFLHNFKLQGIVRLMQRARGCPSPDSPHVNVLLAVAFSSSLCGSVCLS